MSNEKYNLNMRRLVYMLVTIIPITVHTQTNLVPDHTWRDVPASDNEHWWTSQPGSTVCNYQGVMYAFNYRDNPSVRTGGNTFMFTINKNHDYAPMAEFHVGPANSKSNKLVFGFYGESSSYDPGWIIGKTFAFQFNSRLWYFQHVHNNVVETGQTHPPDESYECFAQLPTDTTQGCFTYFDSYNPVPTIIKMGAFQYDSNLYFLGVDLSNHHQWVVQEYSFDPGRNKFVHVKDQAIPNMNNQYEAYNYIGGIVSRMDSLGNQYFIVNAFDPVSAQKTRLCKLTPSSGTQGIQFTYTLFTSEGLSGICYAALIEGSMKGNKTTDPYPNYPDRLTLFGVNSNPASDGTHHVQYVELYIHDDAAGTHVKPANYGEITLPSANMPSKGAGDLYQLVGTYEQVPQEFSNGIGGVNGYQQYIWLFYPDNKYYYNGAQFRSDLWREDNSKTVSSLDLEDTTAYPGIKSLWSLVGIVEGAPPASVDWNSWESSFWSGQPVTTLEFDYNNQVGGSISNSYQDQWSVGESVNLSGGLTKNLEGSIGEEFKYSNTFKNTVKMGTTVSTDIDLLYELHRASQPYGAYIWVVPQIYRYTFSVFPWWDTQLTHPVPYESQYLFRTLGTLLVNEPMPLSDYPFLLNQPNDTLLLCWKSAARSILLTNIEYYNMAPVMSMYWASPETGPSVGLTVTKDSTSTFENTSTFDGTVTVGSTIGLPEVFKMDAKVTGSYDYSYTNEATVTSTLTKKVVFSLKNISVQNYGINNKELAMSAYLFRPEMDSTWWFYDSLQGYKPWYIAYIVESVSDRLQLLTPDDQSILDGSGMLFSWQSERGELSNYTFFISRSPAMGTTNIIYQENLGERTQFNPSGFKPEKGVTYYWAVKGYTANGEFVWSPAWKFSMKEEQILQVPWELKAMVYPNPGKSDAISIFIDSWKESLVVITLLNLNGVTLARKEIIIPGNSPIRIAFPETNLSPGIYFAVIKSLNEQIVRKVMVE